MSGGWHWAQGTVSETLLGDRGRGGRVNEQTWDVCWTKQGSGGMRRDGSSEGVWEDLEHRQTGAHGRQKFILPVEILLGGEEGRAAEEGKGCSLNRNGNIAQDKACSAGQLQVYIPERKLFPDKANSRSSEISLGHMNARAKGRGSSAVQIHLPEL